MSAPLQLLHLGVSSHARGVSKARSLQMVQASKLAYQTLVAPRAPDNNSDDHLFSLCRVCSPHQAVFL